MANGTSDYSVPEPDRYEPETAPKKSGRGCFFFGCITLIVLMVIGGIAIYFVAQKMLNMVLEFTEEQPRELAVVEVSEVELEGIQARVDAFESALRSGEPLPPLELSAEDINALIQKDPRWQEINDKVYVTIDDDTIRGEISLPLEQFADRFAGRFFNGQVDLNVGVAAGQVVVRIVGGEVAGEPLPAEIITILEGQNLTKDFAKDPENRAVLEKIDRVEVRDGKIVVTPRSGE